MMNWATLHSHLNLKLVTVYIDDIFIIGWNDGEHLEALKKVLEHLHSFGLRLKWRKCLFMQPSVEYIVDKDGLHATPAKLKQSLEHQNQQMFNNFDHSWG